MTLHEIQRPATRVPRYLRPTSTAAAVVLLDEYRERARLIAGGTDLVVELDRGAHRSVELLIDVSGIDELAAIVRAHEIAIGVIATPGVAAQDAADSLVAAGITSILNFAPTIISVPHGISERKVDLAVELQILSYHEQRRANARQATKLKAVPGNGRRGASA